MKKKFTIVSPEDITIEEGFSYFIRYCKAKNLSAKTIRGYEDNYHYFILFYPKHNKCSDITEEVIFEYINYLKKNTTANDVSIQSYVRGIRVFLYYLMEQGYTSSFTIKLPKASEKIKVPYTEKELEILMKKPDMRKCTFTAMRNWAMICFFIGTGARLSTVSNCKIADVVFEENLIHFNKVKSRKPYSIPISQELRKILIEYLKYRGGEPNDYLFPTQYNTQLLEDSIDGIIRKYNLSRGIQKTSPHLFRHTFAQEHCSNGGNAFALQAILGHEDLTMTKKYIRLYGNDLQDNFSEFNPLDKVSKNLKAGNKIQPRRKK